jgi:hypothetical protein
VQAIASRVRDVRLACPCRQRCADGRLRRRYDPTVGSCQGASMDAPNGPVGLALAPKDFGRLAATCSSAPPATAASPPTANRRGWARDGALSSAARSRSSSALGIGFGNGGAPGPATRSSS